jgi:peptidoglycan/xylan/chitin deacetylase (PgdA/CDA1 family)
VSATVTFSIEVELGWGVIQYDNLDVLSQGRKAETEALERLLDLCDELRIPMTFNVVGHLMRDSPLATYDGNHEDGWFDDIPKTGPKNAPEFYAPGLVERIQESSVNHEICTHTFTHVECANVPNETLRWEFDKVLEAHEDFGLDRPVSLVPPRHSPPPRDILKEYGIEIVRSSRKRYPESQEASDRVQLAREILTGDHPIKQPRIVDDVIETYCASFPSLTTPFLQSGQKKPHPVFRMLPLTARRRLHKRNLNQTLTTAIERDSNVHIWTHLWETANEIQWPTIEAFLRRVTEARTTDKIQIKNMEKLNSELRHSL